MVHLVVAHFVMTHPFMNHTVMTHTVMAAQAATHDIEGWARSAKVAPGFPSPQRAPWVVVGGRLGGHDDCGGA
jgi:hypothetical protein